MRICDVCEAREGVTITEDFQGLADLDLPDEVINPYENELELCPQCKTGMDAVIQERLAEALQLPAIKAIVLDRKGRGELEESP